MAPTVHELEERLFDLLATPPSDERDRTLLELAPTLLDRGPAVLQDLDEAELWYETAQARSRLGDHDGAIAAMRTALETGWAPVPDGRCDLAALLVAAGRVEEAYALHGAVRRDTPDDVWLYNAAGLDCLEADDPARAREWFGDGIDLALRTGDPERVLDQLADLRRTASERLGRAPDELQLRAEAQVERSSPPVMDTRGTTPWIAAVAWFASAEELAAAVDAWPDLADDVPVDDFATYCHAIEGHLKRFRELGLRLQVAPLTVAGLQAFASEQGLDAGSAEARAQYGTEVTSLGEALPWPPGRNEPCWCGSGRKYKKCCGPAPASPLADG